ncbi:glycerol 3-phosphatase 1 [Fusarium oxysporum NRRL 32931]|uniref:Glycerol 3-phosphatase 1 n=1 Tax=Fusarium oxysporum NRRL 32931 TaxID=660029 RepID=W9HMK2_FUSOX|nr:glycerol 3-phosphatase 1 [Fusarium oxysporum NRRL 32931]
MNGPQAGERQRNEAIFDGLLVDLDGTLTDSTEAVVKHWADVGKRINVGPRVILEMSHGRRSLDVLQVIAPDFATWDFVRSIESVIRSATGTWRRRFQALSTFFPLSPHTLCPGLL